MFSQPWRRRPRWRYIAAALWSPAQGYCDVGTFRKDEDTVRLASLAGRTG